MASANQENPGQQLSAEHRTSSWDHKPQAIVYDPSLDKLETVKCENLNSKCDSFPVHLPWWSNKVDIYVDAKNRSGFVATVQLDRLGPAKNWQRRFRRNYTVLHVKGLKPGKASRASSSPSASIPVVQNGYHSG
ncbi:MAG: hypothetical protein ASARMPREDX12_002924 [Alectoria sarmentosa]|nr:MAG: hypothetical protein ASARMPREDX12_002924 [Alectoria sarmentosa]